MQNIVAPKANPFSTMVQDDCQWDWVKDISIRLIR